MEMQDSARHIRFGSTMFLSMNNNGVLGLESHLHPDSLGIEYPPGSHWAHLLGAGPWIGAIVHENGRLIKRVSTVFNWDLDGDGYAYTECEFLGYHDKGEGLYHASVFETGIPNRRGFDDDGDGRIDEDDLDGTDNDGDWLAIRDDLNLNGKPDTGEPNVDEDYGAVSESDVYFAYRDSFETYYTPSHVPLNIKIWQKTYSWKMAVKAPIIAIEYYFINKGKQTIDSVYLGMYAFPMLYDLGAGSPPNHTAGYHRALRTAYMQNITHAGHTPFGITLLGTTGSSPDVQITYKNFDWRNEDQPSNDAERYQIMSTGVIDGEKSIVARFPLLLSVGPFRHMEPGDTLKLAVAIICGDDVDIGPNSLKSSAAKALGLYSHGYRSATVPPSPPLRISPVANGVQLDWHWRPGDPRFDPVETWDDSNKILNTLPPNHWRRLDPPPGKEAGGRSFEAFRLWRSDYPLFRENSFGLVRQFDVADDLGFEGQTGISFTYVDSSLVRGRSYYYTVTSRSIPDYVFVDYQTDWGTIRTDTILSDPVESVMYENVLRYSVPFVPSMTVGQVRVVPNPYRTDQNYTYQGGGWEGLAYGWNENKRTVWFIHLPPKCIIRIYSLVGESIKSIMHDDAEREARGLAIGQEEFSLLSESNRTLASGIYIYLVESEYGTQTGKFVIIR